MSFDLRRNKCKPMQAGSLTRKIQVVLLMYCSFQACNLLNIAT